MNLGILRFAEVNLTMPSKTLAFVVNKRLIMKFDELFFCYECFLNSLQNLNEEKLNLNLNIIEEGLMKIKDFSEGKNGVKVSKSKMVLGLYEGLFDTVILAISVSPSNFENIIKIFNACVQQHCPSLLVKLQSKIEKIISRGKISSNKELVLVRIFSDFYSHVSKEILVDFNILNKMCDEYQ